MVCDKCEKKLSKIIVPDKWKDGARNTIGGKDGGQKVGKATSSKRASSTRHSPLERRCRICKSRVGQGCYYCQQCAYTKGICTMCGRKVLNTKSYKMSS